MVKKHKARVEFSSKEDDTGSGDEEKVRTKPKGKRKANITAAQPTATEKARQVKAARAAKAGQIRVPDDDDADVDKKSEGSHHDDMIDMQFDLAAREGPGFEQASSTL